MVRPERTVKRAVWPRLPIRYPRARLSDTADQRLHLREQEILGIEVKQPPQRLVQLASRSNDIAR